MIQNDLQRATQRTRNTASFRKVIGNIGSPSSKFDKSNDVLVRGAFRKHRGSGSKQNAMAKKDAHIRYLSGEKHKQAEKAKRELFDDKGQKIKSAKSQEQHENAFIEHRIIISPGGDNTSKQDLHVLSQSMISEVRERNPKAEVSASYAIHSDTSHPHSHVLITSPNVVKLDRGFYGEMREEMKQLKQILDDDKQKDQSLDWSQDIFFKQKEENQDLGVSL